LWVLTILLRNRPEAFPVRNWYWPGLRNLCNGVAGLGVKHWRP